MTSYSFRHYTIHIHEEAQVFIGNDETDFLVYSDREEYAAQLLIHFDEATQAIRLINRWNFTFEVEGDHLYILSASQRDA